MLLDLPGTSVVNRLISANRIGYVAGWIEQARRQPQVAEIVHHGMEMTLRHADKIIGPSDQVRRQRLTAVRRQVGAVATCYLLRLGSSCATRICREACR